MVTTELVLLWPLNVGITKNVPRHILAPAAIACDIYLVRRSSLQTAFESHSVFPFYTFEIIFLYVLYFMLFFFNIFVIICLGFMPGCYFTLTWMAVCFTRRVFNSSDYIDCLFWEILKRRISLCWPLLTWLQWSHCVRLFIVLVTCVESMIPRRKNNRPSSLQNMSGYF